jgi:hypothetical protein
VRLRIVSYAAWLMLLIATAVSFALDYGVRKNEAQIERAAIVTCQAVRATVELVKVQHDTAEVALRLASARAAVGAAFFSKRVAADKVYLTRLKQLSNYPACESLPQP